MYRYVALVLITALTLIACSSELSSEERQEIKESFRTINGLPLFRMGQEHQEWNLSTFLPQHEGLYIVRLAVTVTSDQEIPPHKFDAGTYGIVALKASESPHVIEIKKAFRCCPMLTWRTSKAVSSETFGLLTIVYVENEDDLVSKE